MALEGFQTFIYPIIDIFAVLAVIFAVVALVRITRQQRLPETKKMLSKVFLLFAVGILLWVFAEIGWDVWTFMAGETPDISFLDIFWVAGYFFIIPAFMTFTVFMLKKKENLKKGITTLAITAIALAVVVFGLVKYVIVPGLEGGSALELFIYFFYPIASALMLLSAASVYTFFRQLKPLGLPLLLLALGALFSFLGDVLFTYIDWNDVYGWPGLLSDIFYALDYGFWAVAFFLFAKRSKKEVKK